MIIFFVHETDSGTQVMSALSWKIHVSRTFVKMNGRNCEGLWVARGWVLQRGKSSWMTRMSHIHTRTSYSSGDPADAALADLMVFGPMTIKMSLPTAKTRRKARPRGWRLLRPLPMQFNVCVFFTSDHNFLRPILQSSEVESIRCHANKMMGIFQPL